MDISNLTLNEIISLNKKEYFCEYLAYFDEWLNLGLDKEILAFYYGKPIIEIDSILTTLYEQEKVRYYKNIKEKRSHKIKNCAFCGDRIGKGSIYYSYHPFISIEYKEETIVQVLKNGHLFICESCSKLIPETYQDLLNLKEQLEIEHLDQPKEEINYDALKEQVGEQLEFKVLRKIYHKK